MLTLTISLAKFNIVKVLSTSSLKSKQVFHCHSESVYMLNWCTSLSCETQIGKGTRGDVAILPTLVINDVQYRGSFSSLVRLLFVFVRTTYIHTYIYTRIYMCVLFVRVCVNTSFSWCYIRSRFAFSLGKLERTAVLMALCAAFKEKTDPPLCLTAGVFTSSNPYLDAYL